MRRMIVGAVLFAVGVALIASPNRALNGAELIPGLILFVIGVALAIWGGNADINRRHRHF